MNQLPLALLRSYRRVYVGTPYTVYPGGHHAAWVDAAKITGELIAEGVNAFSPIAHSHAICEHSDLDHLDHDLWMEQDEAFMEVCDALVIVELASWDTSIGIAQEADYFRRMGKPVHRLNPVTMELR